MRHSVCSRSLLFLIVTFVLLSHAPSSLGAISPTTIDTGTNTAWLTTIYQRKMFEAAGRQWVFYSDGINLVYKTSLGGFTWSSKTAVAAVTTGDRFDIKYDGTYMHYARATEALGADVLYRSGTPTADGTISWRAAEQIAFDTPPLTYSRSPVIAVDSYGYPFITFCQLPSCTPLVTKSQWNNGSWSTQSGFPHQLSSDTTRNWFTCCVALSAGMVQTTYSYDGGKVYGQLWLGSYWNVECELTTSAVNAGMHQIAAYSADQVFLTFTRKTTHDVILVNASALEPQVFVESEYVVDAAETNDTFPNVSIKEDNVFVFWKSNHEIYYRFCVVADASWSPKQTLYDGTVNIWGRSLTTSAPIGKGRIMVAWQDSESPLYDIRFTLLDFGGNGTAEPRFDQWLYLGVILTVAGGAVLAYWYMSRKKSVTRAMRLERNSTSS